MTSAETLFSRCCDWTWENVMLAFANPTRMLIDLARVKSAESASQVGNSSQTCMDIGDYAFPNFYNSDMEVVMQPHESLIPKSNLTVRAERVLSRFNFEIGRTFKSDNAVFARIARKTYHCHGGAIGGMRTECNRTIEARTVYIEYIGASGPYRSGKRYHLDCAEQQGLIQKRGLPGKGE